MTWQRAEVPSYRLTKTMVEDFLKKKFIDVAEPQTTQVKDFYVKVILQTIRIEPV